MLSLFKNDLDSTEKAFISDSEKPRTLFVRSLAAGVIFKEM